MKNIDQKSSHGRIRSSFTKILALAAGIACYASVLIPSNAVAGEATQLQYIQDLLVLTGEAPWFPSNPTSRDYIQWARNNGMRPTGGWNLDAPVTTDIIAQTLVQLLGYNARGYGGDYYRTLAREGINLQRMPIVSSDWLPAFMDNPWVWSKKNPPSPKEPKNPKDPKDPKPKDTKDDKGKGRGHNRR